MNTILARHAEEIEIIQATWQSDILRTQQTQRQEYREFVIELYREYQSRLASISKDNALVGIEKKLDGEEIVAAAAGRARQWDNNGNRENSIRSNSGKSSTGPSRQRTGSLASSLDSSIKQPATTTPTEDGSPAVKSILEMGFAKEQAESALTLSNNNVEGAIGLLLESPDKVNGYMAEQKLLQQQQQQQQQQFRVKREKWLAENV